VLIFENPTKSSQAAQNALAARVFETLFWTYVFSLVSK